MTRRNISFTSSATGCDRQHWLTEEDVRVLLGRLPAETHHRLRAVHFNDRSRGARVLGYVNRGRREIAICALPPRLSLNRFLVRGQSALDFGAQWGAQWPAVAVKRFLLYDVFLHELGHLQIIDPGTKDVRRRFALETRAHQFAHDWRRKLWSQAFDHPDPAHNPPGPIEMLMRVTAKR